MKKIKIAYVPLDDRPCNLKLPASLSRVAGAELMIPPRELLGHFKDPGIPEKIIPWLNDVASQVSSAVISAEMLAYGGLVSSRRPDINIDGAMSRLEVLRRLKSINPKIHVSVFSLIMRLSVTVSADVPEAMWKKIFRYSELSDKAEAFGLLDDRLELAKTEKEIPMDILRNYLIARERNHSVNQKLLQLVAEGAADVLIIGEDDVSRYGLHRKEKRELEAFSEELSIRNKVRMMCGADEIGAMLVARRSVDTNIIPCVFVSPSSPEGAENIPLYEDRPVVDSILDHVAALNGRMVKEKDMANIVLFVNTPVGKQHDLFLDDLAAQEKDLSGFVGEIKKETEKGRVVAVADVCFANGADQVFMKELLRTVDIQKLLSFAAWNTASNTIGSALAEALVGLQAKRSGDEKLAKLSKTLLFERFVDDHLYQSILRQKIKKDLLDKDVPIHDLGGQYTPVNFVVREELKILALDLASKHFKSLDAKALKFNIELPWPRIFEVDAEVTKS